MLTSATLEERLTNCREQLLVCFLLFSYSSLCRYCAERRNIFAHALTFLGGLTRARELVSFAFFEGLCLQSE